MKEQTFIVRFTASLDPDCAMSGICNAVAETYPRSGASVERFDGDPITRIADLEAVVAAWRERESVSQECQLDSHFRDRMAEVLDRLVELNQIKPPQGGCYLELKDAV